MDARIAGRRAPSDCEATERAREALRAARAAGDIDVHEYLCELRCLRSGHPPSPPSSPPSEPVRMAAPVPEVAVPSTPKRSGSPVPSASPKRSGSGRAIDHLRAPIRGSDSRTTSAEGRASAETSEQARRASVLRMLQRGPQMSVKSAKWRHARHVAKSCKSSSTRSLRERLQRSDSRRTLIASNATFARKVLQEFASIPRPIYQPIDAVLYGTFIDWLVLFRCPVGPPLTRAIVKHGGAEQLRFLFCVATFDKDRNGKIGDPRTAPEPSTRALHPQSPSPHSPPEP
jgi:hypothetical protein